MRMKRSWAAFLRQQQRQWPPSKCVFKSCSFRSLECLMLVLQCISSHDVRACHCWDLTRNLCRACLVRCMLDSARPPCATLKHGKHGRLVPSRTLGVSPGQPECGAGARYCPKAEALHPHIQLRGTGSGQSVPHAEVNVRPTNSKPAGASN